MFSYVPSISDLTKTFIMNERWILLKIYFSIYWDNQSFFLSICLYGGLHWQIFVCWTISASLGWSQHDHSGWFFLCVPWFNLLVFYWVFCINVHEGYRSVVLFLCCIFVWLEYQSNYSLIKRVWQCSFCFYCVEQFEEYWYKFLVEFCA